MPTTDFLRGVTAPNTNEAVHTLLTIQGGGLSAPVYLVQGYKNITSRGIVFEKSDMQIVWPSTGSDSQSGVQLVLEGVSPDLVDRVHELTSAPYVTFEEILDSDPDTVQDLTPPLRFTNIQITNLRITGTMNAPDDGGEPVAAISIGPHNAPGAFLS